MTMATTGYRLLNRATFLTVFRFLYFFVCIILWFFFFRDEYGDSKKHKAAFGNELHLLLNENALLLILFQLYQPSDEALCPFCEIPFGDAIHSLCEEPGRVIKNKSQQHILIPCLPHQHHSGLTSDEFAFFFFTEFCFYLLSESQDTRFHSTPPEEVVNFIYLQ